MSAEGKVNLDLLTAPFPPESIKQRAGGGNKKLSYVEGHTVIHRLNAATGNNWTFAILKEWQDGDLLKALVELTLPGMGSRQHIGVQKVSANGGEDLHKGHVTDALKKAATLFGVGLELYGPDYGAEQVETQAKVSKQILAQAMGAFGVACEKHGLDIRADDGSGKVSRSKLVGIFASICHGCDESDPECWILAARQIGPNLKKAEAIKETAKTAMSNTQDEEDEEDDEPNPFAETV